MNHLRFTLLAWLMSCGVAAAEPSLVLHYQRPAEAWTDALPVGNGSLGGMVFGGVQQDRIQFNHDTLWVGQPHSYAHDGAVDVLPELRSLLFAGKQREAEKRRAVVC